MEFKLFGKSLFEVKRSKKDAVVLAGINEVRESKFLPDFYKLRIDGSENPYGALVSWSSMAPSSSVAVNVGDKDAKAEPPKKEEKTPKDIYKLRLLDDKAFKMKVDPEYVDEQIQMFKDKLAIITDGENDMRRGANEIGSILSRLENRKKYGDFHQFYDQYPYTTTVRIEELLKEHDYLKIDLVSQFLADLPKEASDAMKAYNKTNKDLCGKQAIFYIIAKKKDFEKTEKRRDPILLAQSPFGHFWQIIGAWDEEMLLVDEL